MQHRNKSEFLTIRVTPETKALVTRLAQDDGRSITGYIEHLVRQDSRRKARTRVAVPSDGH